MIASRNIHFAKIKKGQVIPEGRFDSTTLATLVKYGFVALPKKKKATTKKKINVEKKEVSD